MYFDHSLTFISVYIVDVNDRQQLSTSMGALSMSMSSRALTTTTLSTSIGTLHLAHRLCSQSTDLVNQY
jgi:hypothetical protein